MSGVIWDKRKRNSSENREGGVRLLFCLFYMMLHGTTESSPEHSCAVVHWEDFHLPLEAGELGGCGGVQIMISSGDFLTRTRSE